MKILVILTAVYCSYGLANTGGQASPNEINHAEAQYYLFNAQAFPNPQAYRQQRQGRASRTHSCHYIRSVPSSLRYKRNMGPKGLGNFYQKYTEAYGIPVLGSRNVKDNTLKRACYVLRFLLAGHSGVRQSFYANFGRVAVIGAHEQTTDIPEHSFLGSWWNTRARGLGATVSAPVSTAGEENFLCYKNDRYQEQDIGLHEYAHGVHLLGAKYAIRGWDNTLGRLYNSHRRTGKWARTYSMSTKEELFAEGTQSYFNVNSYSPRPDGVRGPINTRPKLRRYDPALYNLIQTVFPCNNVYIKRCEKNRGKEMSQVLKMDCDLSRPTTSRPATVRPTKRTPKPTTGTSCADKNKNCKYWTGLGYCTSSKFKNFMLGNCKRSCKKCGTPATSKPNTYRPTLRPSTVRPTKSPATSTTGVSCVDKNRSCKYWAGRGYCTSSTYRNYMLDNCKRSCNKCGGCYDHNPSCSAWQRVGYCTSSYYRPYMQANCKKSCGLCN